MSPLDSQGGLVVIPAARNRGASARGHKHSQLQSSSKYFGGFLSFGFVFIFVPDALKTTKRNVVCRNRKGLPWLLLRIEEITASSPMIIVLGVGESGFRRTHRLAHEKGFTVGAADG